jgi:NADH:ubiquinone oxidoreductase subunit 2 (subunit N)
VYNKLKPQIIKVEAKRPKKKYLIVASRVVFVFVKPNKTYIKILINSKLTYNPAKFVNVKDIINIFKITNFAGLYVNFELISILIYVLLGFTKTKTTLEATIKYFFFGLFASTLMI